MHAFADIIAIMKGHQMTLRQIPDKLNRRLREVARKEAKSLNRVALEALEKGLGMAEDAVQYHDLDDLAGTWVADAEFDRVIEELDRVDPGLWK
jgi:predicted transcriptional regulator